MAIERRTNALAATNLSVGTKPLFLGTQPVRLHAGILTFPNSTRASFFSNTPLSKPFTLASHPRKPIILGFFSDQPPMRFPEVEDELAHVFKNIPPIATAQLPIPQELLDHGGIKFLFSDLVLAGVGRHFYIMTPEQHQKEKEKPRHFPPIIISRHQEP